MSVVPGSRSRLWALAAVGCLAAAGGLFVASSATAATTASQMVITGIEGPSTIQVPTGIPGSSVPYVVVQAGSTSNPSSRFTVHVSFYDSAGNPAPFGNNPTTFSITSNRGTLSPSTAVAPGGATSIDIVTSLATAANQVSLTVSTGKGNKVVSTTSSQSQLFDVLKTLKTLQPIDGPGSAGIGGDDNSCTNATSANPVCGVLSLPYGASSGVLLSLGACDTTYAACGSTKGAVVQALVDLSGGSYSKTSPATLVVKCDKTLCGGGSIQNVKLSFSLGGNTALGLADPCPAKNTIGPGQDACVDYVQSKRDNSSDTHLYLLFDHDMRTSTK
jgi:hypothetical protein